MHRRMLSFVVALVLLAPMLAVLAGGRALAQDASPVASPEASPGASPSASPGASPVAVAPLPVNTTLSGSIDVALVANPQMVALEENLDLFNQVYPNVQVNITRLPENEVRQVITQDAATQAGQFDVVTIGTFEAPIFGAQGLIDEVGTAAQADPSYNLADVFPAHIDGLSAEGQLYGLPFYGESAMLFYHKDVLEAAGQPMPADPTWTQIGQIAAAVDSDQTAGICLRGLPGWGEQLAPLTTVLNAFGGRWYDENWQAQLDSERSAAAIRFYIDTVREYGPAGSEGNGFTECETLFSQKRVAMWFDATSAAEYVSSPQNNANAANLGYAYAPYEVTPENRGNWLWNWAFARLANSDAKDAAFAFMSYATSVQYQQALVAREGWARAPTGARQSTYSDPAYLEFAAPFAEIVRTSIENANPNAPTIDPVPYTGGQFVRIPEFQGLGNDVSQQFASALTGQTSVDDAISAANDLANQVAIDGGYQT